MRAYGTQYHPIFKRASWLPGSSVSLWSTLPQVLLSPWKSQGFKEEIVTTIGWYDLLTSTTLESKKSRHAYGCLPSRAGGPPCCTHPSPHRFSAHNPIPPSRFHLHLFVRTREEE